MNNSRRIQVFIILVCVKYSIAQNPDTTKFYAGINATGTMNRTNSSSSYVFNNSIKLAAKKKIMAYSFINGWLYGKQDKRLTNNDYNSSFDVYIFKDVRRFYYWGLSYYTSSYSLRINNQAQSGLGVAYDVTNTKNRLLNLSEGFIYDYSDVYLEDSVREKYGTLRNSFRMKLKWDIPPVLTLQGSGYYQPSLQYKNDYIIRTELSLGLKIRKWISVTAGFNYNIMSRTGAENLFMTYGLKLEKSY